ncbi:MAG: DUF1499 domain-containing protein [Gammaproteobacteria bacterium]|nr:DUF1499 domain-containing protein [Gammaproteobacteria bacterium]
MSTEEKKSAGAVLVFYIAVLNLLIIIVAIAGRMLLDWSPASAFYPFFYAAQFGLIVAVLSALQIIFAFLKKNSRLKRYAFFSLVLGLAPLLGAILVVGPSGFKAPMIHDITTDTQNPPVFSIIASLRNAEENSLDYAGNSIASLQQQAFPDIKTVHSDLSTTQAFSRAEASLSSLGWTVVLADQEALRLEAYEKSRMFGFIDDVSIRIVDSAQGSLIDVRSISRIGEGDLGANAERIRRFFETFHSQL